MPTNNSSNNSYTNNADGWSLAGGTTPRTLTLTAGNVTLSSGGSNTYTFPAATGTLVSRDSTDTLQNKTLDSTNTFNNNIITANSLATNAITLGYAQITSNFVLSSSQTTPTQVTGLSVTVTIPAGSRRVRITGYCAAVSMTAGIGVLSIWDGTVNSGTQLNQYNVGVTSNGAIPQAIVSPAAGSKTYNIGIVNSGLNNTTVNAGSTLPSFILVEAI